MARARRSQAKVPSSTTLFRGDSAEGLAVPDPSAPTSIVEHVLYLGGAGRSTPFTSATESRGTARHLGGLEGRVYETSADQARLHGAGHIDHARLLRDLTGDGKGRCRHRSAWEVAQARAYVVQGSEHLLDWSDVPQPEARARVRAAFS